MNHAFDLQRDTDYDVYVSVPRETRMQALLPWDELLDLFKQIKRAEGAERPVISDPERYVPDIRRLCGEDGLIVFDRLLLACGWHYVSQDCAWAAWESGKREIRADDRLLVDLAAETYMRGGYLPEKIEQAYDTIMEAGMAMIPARNAAREAEAQEAAEKEAEAVDRSEHDKLASDGNVVSFDEFRQMKLKAVFAPELFMATLKLATASGSLREAREKAEHVLNRCDPVRGYDHVRPPHVDALAAINAAIEARMEAQRLFDEAEKNLVVIEKRADTGLKRRLNDRDAEIKATASAPLPSNWSQDADGLPMLSTQETVVPIAEYGATLDDFVAYMPSHGYIFKPTREMWPGSSVNSRLPAMTVPGRDKPIAASAWLDMNRPVEQMTWAPGMEMEIRDRLIADGGWINRPGCNVFNLYRPPVIRPAAGDASTWVNHVRDVFGDDAKHMILWLAHRVQRPYEKINHALVLGGAPGTGKDTMLEPVKHAIGPWNFAEVSPQQMLGRFNGFLKSVILRISEARDLGDTDRFAFYDHLKTYTAAPPDVLRVDEKHMREHAILNLCGVIITTNHKSDGIYLPADDRRHFVAWTSKTRDDFRDNYWNDIYRWFACGGTEIVAHYLATLDLTGFDPKAPPPKTQAFWEIVDASRTPEDAEMADALDRLSRPAAVTLDALVTVALISFKDWLIDRKNRRKIPHRMDECGYVPARNADASDGLWKIGDKRQVVYVRRELTVRDQLTAAAGLTALSGRSSQ